MKIFKKEIYISLVSMVAVFLFSCDSHREVYLRSDQNFYQSLNKYNLRVRFDLSEEYKNAGRRGSPWDISYGKVPFGHDLSKHSTNLIRHMFILLENEGGANNDTEYDAIMTANILSIDHQPNIIADQEGKITISQKWQLNDKEGNTIWLETITGTGIVEMGSAFSEMDRFKERILMAIDDMIQRSANEIQSSIEIKKFVEANYYSELFSRPFENAEIESLADTSEKIKQYKLCIFPWDVAAGYTTSSRGNTKKAIGSVLEAVKDNKQIQLTHCYYKLIIPERYRKYTKNTMILQGVDKNDVWTKSNPFSKAEPNLKTINQKGKEIGADIGLLVQIKDQGTSGKNLYLYLVDIRKNMIIKSKESTSSYHVNEAVKIGFQNQLEKFLSANE